MEIDFGKCMPVQNCGPTKNPFRSLVSAFQSPIGLCPNRVRPAFSRLDEHPVGGGLRPNRVGEFTRAVLGKSNFLFQSSFGSGHMENVDLKYIHTGKRLVATANEVKKVFTVIKFFDRLIMSST